MSRKTANVSVLHLKPCFICSSSLTKQSVVLRFGRKPNRSFCAAFITSPGILFLITCSISLQRQDFNAMGLYESGLEGSFPVLGIGIMVVFLYSLGVYPSLMDLLKIKRTSVCKIQRISRMAGSNCGYCSKEKRITLRCFLLRHA